MVLNWCVATCNFNLSFAEEILTILRDHVADGHFYKAKSDLINNADILLDVVKFFGKAPVLIASKGVEADVQDVDAHPR